MPQLVLNYTTGSADGISLAFLIVWLIGDVTNLAGTYGSLGRYPRPDIISLEIL